MKTMILSLAALVLLGTVSVAQTSVELDSRINAVTVYRSGAQVHRTGKGRVPTGQTILKFSGLSPYLNASSLQFSATGTFTILSVNFQRNYINTLENSEEVEALKAQIEELEDELRKLDIEISVLKEEESLLLANKQIGGQQTSVQLTDLQSIAEYYRTRLKAIKLEQFDLEAEKRTRIEAKKQLEQQLAQAQGGRGRKESGEVWVKVTAERAIDSEFSLNYVVPQAGWKPAYDVRIADLGEDVKLDLKGDVYQSSGEDWRGVTLSLSTGIPTESGVKPEMQAWWLAPYQVTLGATRLREKRKEDGFAYDRSAISEADAEMAPPPPPPAEYVAVEQFERTTTREYRITLPYDIPSDGNPYTVAIDKYELPATYQYYVAPKLDTDAFLTAKVSGWEQYQLLSGPANLFFEGSYLGNTVLDVHQTTDTLELSLGRDKGIIVSRDKDEQYRDKQFIGNKITQNIGWKIELRNTKSKAVQVLVEDQYPISTTDEIEVELGNARRATVDKETGKLSWQVQLVPGASETLQFRYEVKYPKRLNVVLE